MATTTGTRKSGEIWCVFSCFFFNQLRKLKLLIVTFSFNNEKVYLYLLNKYIYIIYTPIPFIINAKSANRNFDKDARRIVI